ncbi:MAG: glycoside hydrolase [Parachlamydia sp.]|nr:glycoside hydrolase [Parachlamydia sp.]
MGKMIKIAIGLFFCIYSQCHGINLSYEQGTIGSLSQPILVLDSQGHAIVAWHGFKNKKLDLKIANSPDGGKTWNFPITLLSKEQGWEFYKPRLVLDTCTGNALIAWTNYRPWGRQLKIAHSRDYGKTWSSPKCLLDQCQDQVELQMVETGHILLATTIDDCIEFFYSDDFGITWKRSDIARKNDFENGDLQETSAPHIALQKNGNALALWRKTIKLNEDDSKELLEIACSKDFGKSWVITQRINTDRTLPYSGDCTHLTLTESGNALICWDSGGYIHVSSSEDSGYHWQQAIEITKLGCENFFTKIFLSENGQARFEGSGFGLDCHDIKQDTLETPAFITSFVSNDYGKTWKKNIQLDNNMADTTHACGASINTGETIVVWDHSKNHKRYKAKFAISSDFGHTWSTPKSIATNSFLYTTPQVVLNESGQAIVAWVQCNQGETIIKAAYSDNFGKTWQQ